MSFIDWEYQNKDAFITFGVVIVQAFCNKMYNNRYERCDEDGNC